MRQWLHQVAAVPTSSVSLLRSGFFSRRSCSSCRVLSSFTALPPPCGLSADLARAVSTERESHEQQDTHICTEIHVVVFFLIKAQTQFKAVNTPAGYCKLGYKYEPKKKIIIAYCKCKKKRKTTGPWTTSFNWQWTILCKSDYQRMLRVKFG